MATSELRAIIRSNNLRKTVLLFQMVKDPRNTLSSNRGVGLQSQTPATVHIEEIFRGGGQNGSMESTGWFTKWKEMP